MSCKGFTPQIKGQQKKIMQCPFQPQILVLTEEQIQTSDGGLIKQCFTSLNLSNTMILQLVRELIQSQFPLVYIMKMGKNNILDLFPAPKFYNPRKRFS